MNPYKAQPPRAFWSRTFSQQSFLDVDSWHRPKFDISNLKIASVGSCFAQHIGKALKNNGFKYLDVEPAPEFLPIESRQQYGYEIYSARYGNVYTVRQLLQLAQRAFGEFKPTEEVWELNGGVVDPFRPTLQPEPFGSVDEMHVCQRDHLQAVSDLFSKAGLIIFTLGLTESYVSKKSGSVFPVCPGVSGGRFDAEKYQFKNFEFLEIIRDFNALKSLLAKHNPAVRFLLTVSPVPLVATATENNVGVATTYSKSVLRAAAGALSDGKARVDYFPSYEIISMPAGEGQFFEDNKRGVTSEGVAHVMANVLRSFAPNHVPEEKIDSTNVHKITDHIKSSADSTFCDEELLAQFGK